MALIDARLESVAKPGSICRSEDGYRQVKARLDLKVSDLGPTQLKNIAEPVRVYALEVGAPAEPKPASPATPGDQAEPMVAKKRCFAPLAAGIAALLIFAAASGSCFLDWRGAKPTPRISPLSFCPSVSTAESIAVLLPSFSARSNNRISVNYC